VLDFAGPFEVFSRTRLVPGPASRRDEASAPFRVVTVARTRASVRAAGGLAVTPHHGFDDAPAIDVLFVPGGWGTRPLLDDAETIAWIVRAAARAELVCSVCTGALLLARAGLLAGKRATTHWGALDLLATFPDVRVDREARVVDEGVLTSAGVACGIDLAFHVVERLCGREVADETAHYIEYRRTDLRVAV